MTTRMTPFRISDNGPDSTPGRRPRLCPCCDETPCLFDERPAGSAPVMPEPDPEKQEVCDQCGEPGKLREVDDSDPSVGYYDTLLVCGECLENRNSKGVE